MATTTTTQRETSLPAAALPGAGFADPAPLGLAAFALTTFVLSVFNAGLIETGEAVVLGLAMFYGGIAQLFAGMWEFAKGNTFGAVAFTSYGAFWLSFWYLVEHADLSTAQGRDAAHAVGVFLLAWGIFTTYMFVASIRVSGVVMMVFAWLTVTFFVLAIGDLSGVTAWTKAGGWLGLVTACLAWYGSFAAVANSTFRRVVLPTFPR